MKYAYLLINLFVLIGPVALSFDRKVAFFKNWKYLIPATLGMMIVFIPWDIVFTEIGVWSFNPKYITGVKLFNLPIEEWLFFITIPYACMFTYECLNAYFPNRFLIKKPNWIASFLAVFCLIVYIIYYDKLYTGITALLALFILFIQLTHRRQRPYLGLFYRAFVVSFIPMLIVDGILTGNPIVIYNEMEKTPLRIGTIPWEDFLYQFVMLYIVFAIYETFKQNAIKKLKSAKTE